MGVDAVRVAVDQAHAVQAEPPRPLYREMPPGEPFPAESLGPLCRDAAMGIHERVQAPIGICAQSVLAVASLASQGHADIELPTGQTRPSSLFLVTVAASGERKTSCDNEAASAVRAREEALRAAHAESVGGYLNARDAWKKAREDAMRKGKGDARAIRSALDALGPEPEAPRHPLLTAPEPTFEGLTRALAIGQPSIGIFSAEGGQFVGGHGMSDEAKLRTAAGLSSIWDGEPIKRVRAGDGVMVLAGRRVSLHLMMQPDVAASLLGDRVLADQGLLSRLLVSAPESMAGRRLWREPGAEYAHAIKRFGERALGLLESPLTYANGTRDELIPRALPLSRPARQLWIAFADHVERQIGPGGPLEAVRGFANKAAEHAARLAAVLCVLEHASALDVDEECMARGIVLAQHYLGEALRLAEAARIDPGLRRARQLLDWLQRSWGEPAVSLPDIYQLGPAGFRDKKSARAAVEILVEHGWLLALADGAVTRGVRRRDAWGLVRT